MPMPAAIRAAMTAGKGAAERGRILAPVQGMGHFIAFWGQVLDSSPHYAAYRTLPHELEMAPREAGAWVRSYAALPNIINRGRSF